MCTVSVSLSYEGAQFVLFVEGVHVYKIFDTMLCRKLSHVSVVGSTSRTITRRCTPGSWRVFGGYSSNCLTREWSTEVSRLVIYVFEFIVIFYLFILIYLIYYNLFEFIG